MESYNSLFLLKGLEDFQKEKIVSLFSPPARFAKGMTIYDASHFKDAIGYILKGTAVASTDNENPLVMKRFKPGMCFGVAAIFGEKQQYVSNIVAESDCVIQFLTESQLREIFELYPQTAVNYIAFLSEKIRFLNHKLGVISCQSAESTVLRYLRSIADQNGEAVLPVSMIMLSKMLGLGRASLYRSLDTLESRGLITREKKHIRVIKK